MSDIDWFVIGILFLMEVYGHHQDRKIKKEIRELHAKADMLNRRAKTLQRLGMIE